MGTVCSARYHLADNHQMPPPEPAFVPASDDPLTIAMQPPGDETPEDRQTREKNEMAALLRSETIDEYLKLSGQQAKLRLNVTRLLLLGVSPFIQLLITTS